MNRIVEKQFRGFMTEDGAGVKLVRVLGGETVRDFDPILMLDSFDSTNPADYTAGFPMHPHRGIETISYIVSGKMIHRDSLGNEDTITDGEVQWMIAGSGILHEERIPASPRLLGVQLWLNLPAKNKMAAPAYHSVRYERIPEIPFDGGLIRVLSGQYKGVSGFRGEYLPFDYYDVFLQPEAKVSIETEMDRSVMAFSLLGNVMVSEMKIAEKTAVKLSKGSSVELQNGCSEAHVLLMSSKALHESIAWGGPIVMNTKAELQKAFDDLNNGTFVKKAIVYDDMSDTNRKEY